MKPTEAIELLRRDIEGRLHAEDNWKKKSYLEDLAEAVNSLIDIYEKSTGQEDYLSNVLNKYYYYIEGWEEYSKRVDLAFQIAGIPKDFLAIPREIVNINWDIKKNIRAFTWYRRQLELIYDDQELIDSLKRLRTQVDNEKLYDESISFLSSEQQKAVAKINTILGTQHSIWSALMSYEQYKRPNKQKTWE